MEAGVDISHWIQVSHHSFISGNDNLINNDELDFKTSIILALPLDQSNFKEGNFKIIYNEKTINIQISKILNKAQDPILSSIRNIKEIRTFLEDIAPLGSKICLPLEMCTDSRGKYPYYCARISFPYRLAGWSKKNHDYDRERITGGYKDKDKIEALFALNNLSQSKHYGRKRELVYEDVTLFIEDYFLRNESQPLIRRVSTFASENAFKNAINYFLGFNGNNYIAEIVEKRSHLDIYPDIQTENDLLEFIVYNTENNIIHYIENQHLIPAFWNHRDEEIPSDIPKRETDIQPTLYLLLQLSLLSSGGIQVVRETDEGVGKLDFKFLYTTRDRKPLCICLEFKLAHNTRIEHGVTRQLPAYMKANKSISGIFAIMWFKDEDCIVFKEPENRTKTEMFEFIKEKSKETNENKGLNIKTLFIDASIRKSASKI
ncbi:MAG: RNA-directed polymerase [Euryarchaeota archaeon]|nr:RNA-directed polymerase [Euryarchaeota archaeon]